METLIKRIQWWSLKKKLHLPDVVNVMLHRGILPLQLRATPMWEHKSRDARPVLSFLRSSLAGMWMRLFKLAKGMIPEEGKDLGFEVGYATTLVIVQYICPCSFPVK